MRGVIGLLFYSVVALAPILVGVFIASRFLLPTRPCLVRSRDSDVFVG